VGQDDQAVEQEQEGIIDEEGDDQANHDQVTAAFANLWLHRKARVSRVTRELLKGLKYPRKFRAKEEDDISGDLEPVRAFIEHNLKPALRGIVLHSNPAVSLEQLRLAILEKTPTITVPRAVHKAYEPLLTSWGIKTNTAELTRAAAEEDNDMAMAVQASMATAWVEREQVNESETAQVELIREELVCIQKAVEYRISLWIKDTPAPAAEDAEWPEDFSSSKRKDLRSFVREYLDKNQEYWAESLTKEQQEDAMEELMDVDIENFPVPKGRSKTVLRAVFNEVRTTQFQQDKRSRSRSQSQSQSQSGPDSCRESLNDITIESTATGESASLRRGKKRVRIVEPQSADEDEDNDSMPVRKVPRSNGGRSGRSGRMS
jgi:hypothetical protein